VTILLCTAGPHTFHVTELTTPYADEGTWLRGNVHTHTTVSDGDCAPADVVADYEARGYDFLAISDHDAFVDPAQFRDDTGLVLLPAVEVTADGPHLQHLGASEAITPASDRQRVLEDIDDRGGVAILNHPRWLSEYAHWPVAEMQALDGYAGIEIYNGLIERHPGGALATEPWDRLLSAGHRVWGYAADDAHSPRDIENAWTVVQATERTPAAILDALAAGRCYASTGVRIRDITADDGTITVATADAERIRLVSDYGQVQQDVAGPEARFRVPEQLVHWSDHTYVRVECLSRAGARAWTQPFFLDSEP
jgi:hypothetical protein